MAKEEWGKKRLCLNCSARFYDLKKTPILCPKCETVFEPESPIKSKRWQASANAAEKAAAETKAAEPAENLEDIEVASTDDDDDDESNDTLLADDDTEDDDVSSVVANKPGVGGDS